MSAPAMLVVTLIFLIAVLSIPVNQPQKLIWLAVYPIVASEMSGIGYGNIFFKVAVDSSLSDTYRREFGIRTLCFSTKQKT